PLARLCGGKTQEEQRAALKAYTEGALRLGSLEPLWDRVIGGVALGSKAFAQRLLRTAHGNGREQKPIRQAPKAATWPQIVGAREQAKKQGWESLASLQGDGGRDAALWVGRRAGRLPLSELGELAGGLDYAVVSKAIARFSRRLASDAHLREQLGTLYAQLSK